MVLIFKRDFFFLPNLVHIWKSVRTLTQGVLPLANECVGLPTQSGGCGRWPSQHSVSYPKYIDVTT